MSSDRMPLTVCPSRQRWPAPPRRDRRGRLHPARADWPYLDGGPLGGRAACRQRTGLGQRRAVDEEKAADHFLGFGERTVDESRLTVAHLDTPALVVGLQRFDRTQPAFDLQRLGKF